MINGSSAVSRPPVFSAKRSTTKTHKSIVTLTELEHVKRPSRGALLSPRRETREMAIQTE